MLVKPSRKKKRLIDLSKVKLRLNIHPRLPLVIGNNDVSSGNVKKSHDRETAHLKNLEVSTFFSPYNFIIGLNYAGTCIAVGLSKERRYRDSFELRTNRFTFSLSLSLSLSLSSSFT